MQTGEKFNFFVPIEYDNIFKAGTKDDGKLDYSKMFIFGQASDNSEDSDGQILEPSGFELNRFLDSGLINYEHGSKDSPLNILGEPTDAYVKDNKFFIKSKLWEHSTKARQLWDTLHTMKKSGSTRKIGYSIEGKTLKVDPINKNRLTKCLITHCALTFSPKNKNAVADIMKGNYAKAFMENEFDETANGGAEYLLDITRPDGTRLTIDKEFNTKVVAKAMTAGSDTGMAVVGKDVTFAAFKKESFDKKPKILQPDLLKSIILISKNYDKYNDIQKAILNKSISNLLINKK
jgi:hypothetical protein